LSLAPELKPKAESFVIFDDEFGISNCRFPHYNAYVACKEFGEEIGTFL
jgi:hypothetical protein